MSKRTTYRKLLSPLAQIEAAEDFVGQMEAMVADTWADRDIPEDTARAKSESAEEFLDELHNDGGFAVAVLEALRDCGLRFESDGKEEEHEETSGVEGYFKFHYQGGLLDFALHRLADIFSVRLARSAPDGWSRDDTAECLGWENLVVAQDDTKSVLRALKLFTIEPNENALRAIINTPQGEVN